MAKKRGLGKPLDALLAYKLPEKPILTEVATEESPGLLHLAVDQIQRGKYQPRQEMDESALHDLANSIKAQGIIQPLIVRPVGEKYEIIAGERRWRAAQLANLTEVPVIIRAIPDEAASAIALIENIQREDLNPIEEAYALERLIQEFGMTHQQIADAVGKSRATVTNLLRLISLPQAVRDKIAKGLLEMGHARALITLPEPLQIEIADKIIEQGFSVREAEAYVRKVQDKSHTDDDIIEKNILIDQEVDELVSRISNLLHLKVALKSKSKGKGKLIIHYRSEAEFDSILQRLNINRS